MPTSQLQQPSPGLKQSFTLHVLINYLFLAIVDFYFNSTTTLLPPNKANQKLNLPSEHLYT